MKTIYTVPPNIGQDVEVPYFTKVLFYDPNLRADLRADSISGPGACVDTAADTPVQKNVATGALNYIYFCDSDENNEQITEIFKYFGSTVKIVNIDNPANRIIKL